MSDILLDEKGHLEQIKDKLQWSLDTLTSTVVKHEKEFKNQMKYLWENRSEMDSMEIFSNKKSVSQIVNSGEITVKQRDIIQKLLDSPYFARVDFRFDDEEEAEAIYIGRFSYKENTGNMLIYDWRAPISSLYYDYEIGRACYDAPIGEVEGEVTRKRQFKIKNGAMEFAIESSINIGDEVLQKELSSTSDKRMKNIVATIQKEQNRIIRNEDAETLIIQGVAGSGKTSIALHRVAYFLYKYKNRLTAQNIMIISPNKVFADYISSVLPELGEEPIAEMGLEDIAAEILGGRVKFESVVKQMEDILESDDPKLIQRIKFKSSMKILFLLEEYLNYAEQEIFRPNECTFGSARISKEFIRTAYIERKNKPVLQRLEEIAEIIYRKIKQEQKSNERSFGKNEVFKKIRAMFDAEDLLSLYNGFYMYLKQPELFFKKSKNTIEFSDVYPLLYVMNYFEGIHGFEGMKHVVIDEMQDYTPVQYAVVKQLFPCRKTILGDFGQAVNPYIEISADIFRDIFENTECVELTKSYRSSYEIIQFAERIQTHHIEPMERHGEEPEIVVCENEASEWQEIEKLLKRFERSEYSTLGIICKSNAMAEKLYNKFRERFDLQLLDGTSIKFSNGITITNIYMAKGLEFDEVIVPSVNREVYHSDSDKNLLYIACTRAMHRLTLTSSVEPSDLLVF